MSETAVDIRGTEAEIPYTADTGEKLVNETFGPNNIRRRSSGTIEWHRVAIRNARPLARELTLEYNGFTLVSQETAVRDFFEPGAIETVYYPEVAELIARLSGAARVHVFDHTLRSGDENEREAKLIREPVLWAHNDSGDGPRVFELGKDGAFLREVQVADAEAVDWEDIAIRGSTVYVGDIGDNLGRRQEIAVYRFAIPETPTTGATRNAGPSMYWSLIVATLGSPGKSMNKARMKGAPLS